MIPVDAFDLKILGALQDDGRLTNQQLADAVGLSASQCSRRRMRLEQDRVISGYHADPASEALGFNVIAFIHITLATHSPDNAKRFRALVNRVDDIQEAYSLTGDADYVLKAVLRDLKSLSDIVNNVTYVATGDAAAVNLGYLGAPVGRVCGAYGGIREGGRGKGGS